MEVNFLKNKTNFLTDNEILFTNNQFNFNSTFQDNESILTSPDENDKCIIFFTDDLIFSYKNEEIQKRGIIKILIEDFGMTKLIGIIKNVNFKITVKEN